MTQPRRFTAHIVPKTLKFDGLETTLETAEMQEALAKFQLEVMQPKKDADNPFYGSKYVPFSNIVKEIMSVAPKYGLSYVQWAVQNEKNQIGMCTRINHKSGQWMIFAPVFYAGEKPTIQAGGSVQSYLRRYSLQAAFGLGAEEDDDGNAEAARQEKTGAQLAYEKNQQEKNKSTYQKGDYKNKNQNNNKTSPNAQNGTNKPSEQSGNTNTPETPEMITDSQKTKIKAIIETIANTQNIHPDDVYPKFQKVYEVPNKKGIPNIENLTKKYASFVIGALSKHNENGNFEKIVKEDPKKEETKTEETK